MCSCASGCQCPGGPTSAPYPPLLNSIHSTIHTLPLTADGRCTSHMPSAKLATRHKLAAAHWDAAMVHTHPTSDSTAPATRLIAVVWAILATWPVIGGSWLPKFYTPQSSIDDSALSLTLLDEVHKVLQGMAGRGMGGARQHQPSTGTGFEPCSCCVE